MINQLLKKLDEIHNEIRHNSSKELLTISDAALMLGFSKSYLYKLTSQRIISHYKVSKTIFFKRSELMQWVEKGKVITCDERYASYSAKNQYGCQKISTLREVT